MAVIVCTVPVWAWSEPNEPPMIPVGLDAYRQWDRWPYHRIGARAYMRSTYDRRGGNEGADASHFLYQLGDDFNVTLDVAGPGVLYFARYNHWHGSPWHYEVDGVDHIVRETGTADPVNAKSTLKETVFIPEEPFPNPLTWTWSTTKGADLMWVPLPFERTFRMAYSRTRYGTGYYIYHLYDRSAPLSRPIRAWDGKTPPARDVLDLLNRAGTDIAPRPEDDPRLKEASGELDLAPRQAATLTTLNAVPAMVRAVEFSVSKEQAIAFGRARLRVTWDERKEPSIDAPVALFFGAGTLYNRDGREFLVKGFPAHIRFTESHVHLACYFPMPFFKSARLELIGGSDAIEGIQWRVRHHPLDVPASHVGYFHATYRDHPSPEPGQDLMLLDTRLVEGGGEWSGSFVGSSWIFSHRGVLNTLEGDPRFFFDDSQTPQAYGTGTEEWGGGGDYWGGLNMTLPLAGHPCGARSAKEAKCDEDLIESAYRFLLADLMPFGRRAVIRLEHGGENQSTEHYETVAYWYGTPVATLVQTDELKIGDADSERAHRYDSPQASEPYEITSRYEWGPDTLAGKEVYPPHTDVGRKTTGTTEFSVRLNPSNFGVLLRRKLDYSFPDQRAEVLVADEKSDFKPAGIWYLAGGNTCVYSNPKEELGAAQHIIQTSNRRFRDDEFIIPRDLTRGRSQVRIRIKFIPVEIPLFPGQSLPESAWSEIHYTAYCWVMPSSVTQESTVGNQEADPYDAKSLRADPTIHQPVVIYSPDHAPATPKVEDLPLRESASQYGITWTFEQPARVGQFINGDWYVVGPVTIRQIDPRPLYGSEVPADQLDHMDKERLEAQRVRNGFTLNPPARMKVAYDSGVRNWFDPSLIGRLPVAMKPGDSLVSTISMPKGLVLHAQLRNRIERGVGDSSPIRTAAVLTCVSEPQPPDAFRPAFCDRNQKIYLARDLRRERLPAAGATKSLPQIEQYIRFTQRPWVGTGFFGFEEPVENMPQYGLEYGRVAGIAALLLCTDLKPEQKEPLLVNYVQVGIDLGGMVRAGHPGWTGWGGHGSGRKLPIVFAGLLLGDDELAGISQSYPKVSFGEDEQTAYGDCWTGAKVVFAGHSGIDAATGEGRSRGNGWGPYEHTPPSQWKDGQNTSESYRRCCTSVGWVAQALALRLMHAEIAWGHDAFFDYVDRWMYEDDAAFVKAIKEATGRDHDKEWARQGQAWDAFVNEMWVRHRPMLEAPTDRWQKQHDDAYYRAAITKSQ